MATTNDGDGANRWFLGRWRSDLAPLIWVPVGLLLLLCELLAIRLVPSVEDDAARAVWTIGTALLHALAVLLGTLAVVALPSDRLPKLRRATTRASVAIFGFAGLASHGWALWVILARVEAPKVGWIRLDPIVDMIGGLYVAAAWLALLALLTLGAWLGTIAGRRRGSA